MTERPERPSIPTTGDEREILAAQLDRHRATVEWKCRGLSEEQARRVHLPSAMTTIAGLLSHLALNEWYWFAVVLDGEEDVWEERLKEDPDAEFRAEKPMPELLAGYAKQCERSREIVAARSLDDQVTYNGERFSVRWVAQHMLEETARHLGHLDLLRELTDGLTGE